MTELTLEILEAWYNNPTTQHLLDEIAEKCNELRCEQKYKRGKSSDEIALECAKTEGIIEGVLSLQTLYEDYKHYLTEQRQENQ